MSVSTEFSSVIRVTAAAAELEKCFLNVFFHFPEVYDPVLKSKPRFIIDRKGLDPGSTCEKWDTYPFYNEPSRRRMSIRTALDTPHIDIRFGTSRNACTLARIFPTFIRSFDPDGNQGQSAFKKFSKSSFAKMADRSIEGIRYWKENWINDREINVSERLTMVYNKRLRQRYGVWMMCDARGTNAVPKGVDLVPVGEYDFTEWDHTEGYLRADSGTKKLEITAQVEVDLRTRGVSDRVNVNGDFPIDTLPMLLNLFNSDNPGKKPFFY